VGFFAQVSQVVCVSTGYIQWSDDGKAKDFDISVLAHRILIHQFLPLPNILKAHDKKLGTLPIR